MIYQFPSSMIAAFSGGAIGADLTWEKEAKSLNLPISFTHYRPEDCANLNPTNVAVVHKAIVLAAEELGKMVPTDSYALIQRNYLIARASDKMWAIGSMIMAPNGWAAIQPYGGTSWGVQFAIDLGKEVIFFDQLKEVWWWYHHQFLCWVPLEGVSDDDKELILSSKPALIGSRRLSKAGLAAIQQVLTQTKQQHEQVSAGK